MMSNTFMGGGGGILPKAAVFDMDGVLIDTEIRWEGFHDQVWKKFGLSDSKKVEEEIIGMNLTDTIAHIRKYDPLLSEEEGRLAFQDAARVIYNERAKLLPGVRELLQEFFRRGIPLAIGSSSSLEWIGWALDRFGLRAYFSHLCSSETEKFPGKPDPAVYVQAMRLLGVSPEETVIFEDTERGLRAAVASGARTVAIPDKRWSRGDFSIANIVVESLEDSRLYEYLGL